MTPGDWPSIDHSLLSPSGHISKRARAAALRRYQVELNEWESRQPKPQKPAPDSPAIYNRRVAAELRALAARGMCPRKYAKEAARLEAEAERIERED